MNQQIQRPVEFTYDIPIDFDEAHTHWTQNKRKLSNGMYRYICTGLFKTGNPCNRSPLDGKNTCRIHDANPSTEVVIPKKPKPQPKPKHTTTTTLPSPDSCVPDTNEASVTKGTFLQNWKKYTDRIRAYIRTRRNMVQTVPVEDPPSHAKLDLYVDVGNETIQINTTPIMFVRFEELRDALNRYYCIDRVCTPDVIRKNRHDIMDVAYYLQTTMLMLEGLSKMTKLTNKHATIVMMKTHILLFMNYPLRENIHTTEAKWHDISRSIQYKLLTILDDIFLEIDNGVIPR